MAKNNVAAKNLWLEMIKEQLRIPDSGQQVGLSWSDQQRWVHTHTHMHTIYCVHNYRPRSDFVCSAAAGELG